MSDELKESKKMKVFLGGTCNGSKWRDELINQLSMDYFNPVVEDWTPECMEEEVRQREECSFCLYVITPKMMGVYSIAEVVDDSNKRPGKTIFCFLTKDGGCTFSESQVKSLNQVRKMVIGNGGFFFSNLSSIAIFLNMCYEPYQHLKGVSDE